MKPTAVFEAQVALRLSRYPVSDDCSSKLGPCTLTPASGREGRPARGTCATPLLRWRGVYLYACKSTSTYR